jgi:ubiquitin carboxyl-terminal hydrolase 4/11/15
MNEKSPQIIPLGNDKIKYDLVSVINHYGSMNFGHYTAFAKNSNNNTWYYYDDTNVT